MNTNRCNYCGDIIDREFCSFCNKPKTFVNNPSIFFKGLFYFFEAISIFFKNKKLQVLSILPILVTLILLGFLYYFIFGYFTEFISHSFEQYSGGLYSAISSFVIAVGSIGLIIIVYFLFIFLASIVAIPFNEIISIETEKILINNIVERKSSFWIDIKLAIKEIPKLLFFKLIVILFSLPLLLIPVIGNIVLLVILSMLTSIDFFDIIFARKKYVLSEKIRFIKRNFLIYLFFSLPFLIIFFIPIAQLFVFPLAAIASSKLYLDLNK